VRATGAGDRSARTLLPDAREEPGSHTSGALGVEAGLEEAVAAPALRGEPKPPSEGPPLWPAVADHDFALVLRALVTLGVMLALGGLLARWTTDRSLPR